MSYSADSFSAGEQPTTAKWNKLWSNDASFNDGTGIAAMTAGGTTAVKNSYKFSVYRNAALTTSVNGVVTYDTRVFDTGSNLDIVTNKGRFTAPIAGFYQFEAALALQYGGSGNIYSLSFWKNGSNYHTGYQTVSTTTQTIIGQATALIQLAASDYIEVVSQGASTTATVGQQNTYFHGFYVSTT
jgi:hypothetical protein